MTELTDEAVKALLAHYELPTDCDCDDDDCVKCSHYPTFQERASKQLKAAAPDLARALLDARVERDRLAAELAAANAREAGLTGLIRWAHDTLWELNPSNYDHDEVCKVNDAAVEVILGLAPVIGETHGHSAEWWAERAALAQPSTEGGE